MTVPIQIAGTTVEAVVDCGATGPVVGRTVATRIGIWKRATKARIRQADRSHIKGGKYVVNSSFIIPGALEPQGVQGVSCNKFCLDAEVFDIGQKDVILGLSWLKENGFSVDVPNSRLINEISGVVIPCTTRHIPSITLLSLEDEAGWELEEGEILLMLDTHERYSRYTQVFSKCKDNECTCRLITSLYLHCTMNAYSLSLIPLHH